MDKIVLSIFRHGSHFVYNILQSLFYYVDISNEIIYILQSFT